MTITTWKFSPQGITRQSEIVLVGSLYGATMSIGAHMVYSMPNSPEWDVTIGSRIEQVTDQDAFPELFLGALVKVSEITVIQFTRPSWPHTISVVIRVSASCKQDAESQAKALVLPALLDVAGVIGGVGPFGWTMSVDAKLASAVAP